MSALRPGPGADEDEAVIGPGDRAPDLVLETPDGDRISLRDEYASGPVLLTIFKRDCAACKILVPRLPRFAESYDGLKVWTISQDDPASTREFLVEQAPSLLVLVEAPEFEASRAFRAEAVPAVFLVSADGTVLDTMTGWDRDRFNALSARVASELGAPYRELVGPDEPPAYRPG